MERAIANENLLDWGPHPRFAGVMTKVLISGGVNPWLNVNRVHLDPGKEIPLHTHEDASETFYVLEGRGVCVLGADEIEFEPGFCFYAAPGYPHSLRNRDEGALEVLAIFSPPTA